LSAANTVTILEAGPADYAWDFRLHMPAALSHVLSNDQYNWFYHSEPEPGLNNRPMYCPRGRVLGGSSSINGMVYVRGNPQDFDNWARYPGLETWTHAQCLPYFKRAEDCQHGDEQIRGRKGPLYVGRSQASNPLVKAWLDAGVEAGFKVTADLNGSRQEGISIFDCTIKSGRRVSAAQAYLHPIMGRSNLQVIRLVREIVSQQAFEDYRGKELKPGSGITTDTGLDEFIKKHSESAYHPSCTCSMGNGELAVVDAAARVHGIQSLRVIDASIMPDITNGNLNAPVIMMAEKLGDVILGKEPEQAPVQQK